MRKLLFLTMLVVLTVGADYSQATDYFIGPGDYLGGLGLVDFDTLLMTGGKIDGLSLSGHAIATIENSDLPIGIIALTAGSHSIVNISGGGINNFEVINESTVNITGGSINRMETGSESMSFIYNGSLNSIEMHHSSVSHLYGGEIGTLASDQLLDVEPWWPDAWIHIYCLDGYQYDDNTNLLTGQWGDGMDFNISLLDIGTFPTYDLIEFHIIPEPATISLLAAGFLGMYKKKIA